MQPVEQAPRAGPVTLVFRDPRAQQAQQVKRAIQVFPDPPEKPEPLAPPEPLAQQARRVGPAIQVSQVPPEKPGPRAPQAPPELLVFKVKEVSQVLLATPEPLVLKVTEVVQARLVTLVLPDRPGRQAMLPISARSSNESIGKSIKVIKAARGIS